MKKPHLFFCASVLASAALLTCIMYAVAREPARTGVTPNPSKQKASPELSPGKKNGQWSLSCAGKNDQQECSVTNELRLIKDNQRILLLEIRSDDMRSANAILTLPFGLSVSEGITVQVDKNPASLRVPFSTCLPQGCIVLWKADELALTAMRQGKLLRFKADVNGHGSVIFEVSLQGFSESFLQMVELNRRSESGRIKLKKSHDVAG